MTSAARAASASGRPRSIAPRRSASEMAVSELTPMISPENPAFFSASPNDPPIRPTPTIATVRNSEAPPHRGRYLAELTHQFGELVGIERLGAVAQGVVRVVMDFD